VLVRNSRYMQDAVAANNVHAVAAELHNSFERVVPKGSSLRTIKDALRARGALGTLLSGSGSAVFGLFDDREAALAAADADGDGNVTAADSLLAMRTAMGF